MKIGNVELDSNVVLAPMAGVSNNAYRLIAREFGSGLMITEMVSDKAILNKNERTLKMLEIAEIEKPASLQISGNNKNTLAEAARYIDKYTNADIIDINMGCPVPKITKNGAGSKWLLDPFSIEEAVATVVKAVNKPVTVKIRTGWDERHKNAVENAKALESAGASAIAVHGRTKEQMYAGKADWNIIKQVKDAVSIPVFGNGDIFSPLDAKRMIDETNVDGVMIGRGALGNPWIIYNTVRYLKTGVLPPEPTAEEKIKIAFLHMDRLIALKGEVIGVKEMRKHAGWYIKGLQGSSRIRERINEVETKGEMMEVLLEYVKNIEYNVAI